MREARETKMRKMPERTNYMDERKRQIKIEDDQERWSGEPESSEKGSDKGEDEKTIEKISGNIKAEIR